MINKDQIEQTYTGETLEAIKDSLGTLVTCGFFQFLVKANQHQVAESFESQDENELMQRIRDVRQENKVLLTLNSLYPPQ